MTDARQPTAWNGQPTTITKVCWPMHRTGFWFLPWKTIKFELPIYFCVDPSLLPSAGCGPPDGGVGLLALESSGQRPGQLAPLLGDGQRGVEAGQAQEGCALTV